MNNAMVYGIVGVGFILQLTTGPFDFFLLASPINRWIGGGIIVLCLSAGWLRHTSFIKRFTGLPFSIALISALLILTILAGLTPQTENPETDTLFSLLGFNRIGTSWAFMLIYTVTLLSLGSLIVRKLWEFRRKDYTFYLHHTGLWVVLFAAGLGYTEREEYLLPVLEGAEEQQGYDSKGYVKELPLAIRLNDFDMEEYSSPTGISEPKRFFSDIEVYTSDGKTEQGVLEVNHPIRIGHWTIYQSGYDASAGRLSSYSNLKLVYDPWLLPVYIGFSLMAGGAIVFLVKGYRIKKEAI